MTISNMCVYVQVRSWRRGEERRPGRWRVREDQEEERRCLPSHPRRRRTPAGEILFPSFFDPFPATTTATGGRRRPRDIPDVSKRFKTPVLQPPFRHVFWLPESLPETRFTSKLFLASPAIHRTGVMSSPIHTVGGI